MAGYGIRSFLIAQSLNQIERAYGPNNAILDNCHVRVAFATNDERTAKRVSDALGTATEIRDSRNYAGHRLSPWLGHLMVSRQETARPLLTPGEVMQLPPTEEIVLVSGCPPIRARKARYYEDRRLRARVVTPPDTGAIDLPLLHVDDWTALEPVERNPGSPAAATMDGADGGIRREPALPEHEQIAPEPSPPVDKELPLLDEDQEDDAARARTLRIRSARLARQAALDPGDGIAL
jgi:type IV secretion system protein VirD4